MALKAKTLENKIKPSLKTAFEKITLVGIVQSNFKKVQRGAVVLDKDAYDRARHKALALAADISSSLAKDLAEEIVKHMKTASITSTIKPQTISTVGSPSAQVGPVVPLNISGSLK